MQYDVAVIGGGIVGLASALALLEENPQLKLLLLEKESELAVHQTGHNSGVIHSGIYYKPGGLKAENCLSGYKLLTQFCEAQDVPFEICGKIIVATHAAEKPYLNTLFERGQQHGLTHLKKLKKEELKEYEPHATGVEGLFVPQTGIVDFKMVAQKYGALILQKGGTISLNSQVIDIRKQANGCTLVTQKESITARLIVNCSGLYSDTMAAMNEQQLPLRIIPFRGEYYTLREEKKYLVRNLIYPVPNPNFPFLGVHFTRTIGGGIEAGPNAVLAFKKEGYQKGDVDIREFMHSLTWPGFQKVMFKYWKTGIGEIYRSFSKTAFTKALQKLIPEIQEQDIVKGGAGVRAQACSRDGQLIDDFVILENKHIINICNAPSPAATASLAIGHMIGKLVKKKL